MNDDHNRRRGALLALTLLGWQVSARLARTLVDFFLKKSARPSMQSSSDKARRTEQRKADTAAFLVLGGALGWRALKSLLRSIGKWLLSGPKGPRGGATPPPSPADGDCGCAQRGRAADRNLDAEHHIDLARRERWGARLVVLAFSASVVGGISFLVAYWTGGSNELLGGMLALCFCGLGVTMVVWARWLTVHKEAIGEREGASSPEDHAAAASTFKTGAADIRRRKLLGGMAAGGAGLIGAMVISMFRSLGTAPDLTLYSYVWKRGQRLMTVDGKPVAADALPPGGTIIVFPEDSIGSEKAQTVLLRVDPALLRLPTQRQQWAPMGNLAYSRVCTHAGCSVGMYEATAHQLMCPCHQSTFDVLRAAEPTGGPAARALPQLPLYTDSDGYLRAGGGFTEPPGPGFWGMPA